MSDRRKREPSTRPAPPYDPEARVVAVTGARGFIGAEVIKRLEEDRRYAKVIALDLRVVRLKDAWAVRRLMMATKTGEALSPAADLLVRHLRP